MPAPCLKPWRGRRGAPRERLHRSLPRTFSAPATARTATSLRAFPGPGSLRVRYRPARPPEASPFGASVFPLRLPSAQRAGELPQPGQRLAFASLSSSVARSAPVRDQGGPPAAASRQQSALPAAIASVIMARWPSCKSTRRRRRSSRWCEGNAHVAVLRCAFARLPISGRGRS